MEAELENKHHEKKKLVKEMKGIAQQLKLSLNIIIYNVVIHQINKSIKSKIKAIKYRHEKKLLNLKKQQTNICRDKTFDYIKHTVHNFSSYVLSDEEWTALSFGLDQHIPNKTNKNKINSEFERFYQSLLRNISHIPDDKLTHLKTKLRDTCDKFNKITVPYKYKNIINNLSKNSSIIILRQDKGRGVVILDKTKYMDKCLSLLDNEQFIKLNTDPTKSIESKIQRAIRKIKNKISENEYKTIYPTGSAPGKFYGTAKIHKLKENDTVEELPLRPIISNIGTASYHLAKYLAKLLSPLSKSEYTIESTNEFIDKIKNLTIPQDFKLVSFDVKSLFTNVPLNFTIDVILKRIYTNNEIETRIPKNIMKEMLLLCTKNVHFSYNNSLYMQCDGVAMGSPLGPVIAGIFMVELERMVVPTLKEYLRNWTRYVDDTLTLVREEAVQFVLSKINNFHKNIQFTYEIEKNNNISFLDVLVIRNNNKIDTKVFRKSTNNDIYLHWNSFAPKTWKRGTLKTLIKRAYIICSTDKYLREELHHICDVFNKINGFPMWVIKQIMKEMKEKQQKVGNNNNIGNSELTNNTNEIKVHQLCLPYKGDVGSKLLSKTKNVIRKVMQNEHKTRIIFTSTKLSSKFNIKDKTNIKHQHDIVYQVKCPETNCQESYIGETGRRFYERICDHIGKDKNSHVLKHSMDYGHTPPSFEDFKVINKGFGGNTYKRKLSEALLIKQLKPTLNVQEKSIPLKLFN